jgi:hypothetical protein
VRTQEDDDALAAAQRLADSCADVLRSGLVAAILHGSLTQHDFRPGESDLDLLLVVERALSRHEAEALVEVGRSAASGPADGIDLLVVTRQAAALATDEDPGRELGVGRWPGPDGGLEVEGRAEHVSDNWPELSESRANGRSLLGPDPRTLIGEVPAERVRANSRHHLHRWLGLTDDARHAAFMVVTACRMWRFELTGDHVSKTAAARWALERDPSLAGVRSALLARTTSRVVAISPAEVESVLLRVLSDLAGDTPTS